MHRVKRIPIRDINQLLTCVLCKGYLIDATAIIECLHTFCKSCIVRYLENNKYCPICEVQVHKTKPLLNIRPDKTLQDIVYKLVPKLFQNEMRRRREFYESHPEGKPSSAEQCGEAAYQHLLPPDETVCLTLRYHEGTTPPRYLRCPAAVSVGHLQKLIRAKYDLTNNHRIDILYNQDCLNSSLTLMDIAYIYLWKRKGPIELTYRIYESTSKRLKLEKTEEPPAKPEPLPVMNVTESSTLYTNNNNINNNNNWKEVQLRISENGEMSVTGIQDSLPDVFNTDEKEITVIDSNNSKLQGGKREVPGLKLIGKMPTSMPPSVTLSTGLATTASELVKTTFDSDLFSISKTVEDSLLSFSRSSPMEEISRCTQSLQTIISTTCISLSSATTTTVFSTINASKCSVTISDDNVKDDKDENTTMICSLANKALVENKTKDIANETKSTLVCTAVDSKEAFTKDPAVVEEISVKDSTNKQAKSEEKDNRVVISEENKESKPATTFAISTSTVTMLGTKRKLDVPSSTEQTIKQPKPTILNHSLSLQNLSNNHPSKKHSQSNRIIDLSDSLNKNNCQLEVKKVELNIPSHSIASPVSVSTNTVTPTNTTSITTSAITSSIKTTATCELSYSRMNFLNKNVMYSMPSSTRQETPLSLPRTQPPKYQPCYMPKTNYSPIVNVPRVQSTVSSTPTIRPAHTTKADVRSLNSSDMKSLTNKNDAEAVPVVTMSQTISINNKLNLKSKPSSPIGYKTLRDPPKSWNSQISKANLSNISKPVPDLKNADPKNTKPAKFFKMRNNLPRYLGNPASGVKPMYQVHVSPEKTPEGHNPPRNEKSEIKKHSIVKIDPKTLKPISEKAPETTSLSNQSDLKINTSSVSIFNPLKLQSSPKNERKSPKSPHSPKLKSTSPPNKREKLNLNFTPSNPFIPNLASPTVSPNQFLYPSGPPGFPSYDPRVMAAYHSLFYGQRLPFPPATLPGLSLDIGQRNNFDMVTPSSPKTASMSSPKPASLSRPHSPQTSLVSHATSKSSPQPILSTVSAANSKTQITTKPTISSTVSKLSTMKKNASDKSLLTAVEKLTQNRVREIVRNETVNNVHSASDNNKVNSVVTNKTAPSVKTESENDSKITVEVSDKVTANNKVSSSDASLDKTATSKETQKENTQNSENADKDIKVSKSLTENCKNVNHSENRDTAQSDKNRTSEMSSEKKTCNDKIEENSADNKLVKSEGEKQELGKDSKDSNSREPEKTSKENESSCKTVSDDNHLKELNCNIKSATAKAEKVACDEKIVNANTSSSAVV